MTSGARRAADAAQVARALALGTVTRGALTLVLGAATAPAPTALAQSIAIRNATVIDAVTPAPRPAHTVVIRDGRIVAVGPAASTPIPSGARSLDAGGRFVIPGLWDMHVHTDVPGGRGLLAAYVVNGVTGVRDMGGNWDTLRAWRREIAAGRLTGPRIIASGPYLEGNPQPIPHIRVQSPEEARRGVDSLAAMGVDLVKVHTGITREVFLAVAARAREINIPFAGHVPRVIGAAEAAAAGQRSLEHLLTVPTPCSPTDSLRLLPRFTVQRVLGPCSSESLEPLYAAFVRNGTWVAPTYAAAFEVAEWPQRALPGDAYAKYLPDTLRKFVAAIFPMPDSIPPDAHVVGREMFARRVALAGAMQRAGVRLLAGTDAPLRNSPPGFGLAAELELLASGGLTPLEVLKVATWEPAAYLERADSAGVVAPGYAADLVILEANPLSEVAAYRRVWAVVANGRLLTAADRRRILERLEIAGRAR